MRVSESPAHVGVAENVKSSSPMVENQYVMFKVKKTKTKQTKHIKKPPHKTQMSVYISMLYRIMGENTELVE